jgi:hypothetical protein
MRPPLILAPHGTAVLEPLLAGLGARRGLRLARLAAPAELSGPLDGSDLLAPVPGHDPVDWADDLGAWRQPTLVLLDGADRPASQGALHHALLRLHRVPILGLLQVGGDWDAALRRRDGLPWFPPLTAPDDDPHAFLALLQVRRRGLHHAFMASG